MNANIVILMMLIPFVNSSVEGKTSHSMNNNNQKIIISGKLQFEITVHGFLLWASMGLLMPVGILIIRMSHREECRRRLNILFYVHACLQILSTLLITTGAVMSIKNFNNSFNNHHQRIGLALYAMTWLQSLSGFLRPQRGAKTRSAWFCLHWILGTALSILGVINIYTGLQAYHYKTSRSIHIWTVLLTTQLSVVVFLYLFQDKWLYIQKQGVILGSNELINSTDQAILSEDQKHMESISKVSC